MQSLLNIHARARFFVANFGNPLRAPQAEIRATEIIDVDQWIVLLEKVNPANQTADEIERQVEAEVGEQEAVAKEEQPFTLRQEATVSYTQFSQRDHTQLAFSFSGSTATERQTRDKPDSFVSGLSAPTTLRQITSALGMNVLLHEHLAWLMPSKLA